MKTNRKILRSLGLIWLMLATRLIAQVPVADFTISPNPVCTGITNTVQITDMSTNSPASWSYTLPGTGPPPATSTLQNPVVSYNAAGVFTITLVATNSSGASSPISHTILVLASPVAFLNPQNFTTCIGGSPVAINVAGPGGAANTFSWSTGATGSSISVTPSVTTIYTCVITSTANGCSVTRTSTVDVSTPTVTILSNPVNICPGSASTLVANGTGGGPYTYSWSNGATTKAFTTTVAGVYSVMVTNAIGCSGVQTYSLGSSSTLSLTPNSTPSVLCAGSTGTISVTGASSYTWSTGAVTANSTVNPTSSTTYTVIGAFGTCTGTASITYSVNVSPTITAASSPSAICPGNQATLTANGASAYTWTPGAGTTQVISVTPSVNTTYTLRGLNTGCPAKNVTISISVLPNPVLLVSSTSSLACNGDVVAIAASGANTYSWNTGGTSAIILVTPNVTTTYTVTGTSTGNCKATASITQSVTECTGINEWVGSGPRLELYPNPNNGSFILSSFVDAQLNILNSSGQVVKILELNENNRRVNISGFSPGVYFITGKTAEGLIRQKVIVAP